jgi:hypothetical protein
MVPRPLELSSNISVYISPSSEIEVEGRKEDGEQPN